MAQQPVKIKAAQNQPRVGWALVSGDIVHGRGLDPFGQIPDHGVARLREAIDREQIQTAEIKQSSPDHHAGSLAGAGGEVALVYQEHFVTGSAEAVIQTGAVDSAAEDGDVEGCAADVLPGLLTLMLCHVWINLP